MKKVNGKFYLIGLLAWTLSMVGCATKSPDSMPVQPPKIPPLPPTLAKPAPQESYLERARMNIEAWQKKLTSSESK